MDYQKKYEQWLHHPAMEKELKRELEMIATDQAEVSSCFSRELTFGTGGIRGQMGAGIARLNIYIIHKVTAGLANYLHQTVGTMPSVVIAYDTRHKSRRFARETAAVLTYRGIKAWLFEEPVPTPLLSFAVRELKASAGVVITASHNPPSDNGYKVYGSDGGQITDTPARDITAQISLIEDELAVPVADLEKAEKSGLFEPVGQDIEELYFKRLQELYFSSDWWGKGPLPVRVVYTPLHGTGSKAVPRALKNAGVKDLFVVPEQAEMDPDCPTVCCPNPEEPEVFDLAVILGRKEGADLLLATDLDADRLGAMVRSRAGDYVTLTGNQLGCLMLDYLLSRKQERGELPANGTVIQTVVTTAMGKAVAGSYGVELVETLTGFKYLGEQIKEHVDTGKKTFLFGFEESCGYLAGNFVRDKDGIQAAQLAAEMVAYYNHRGLNALEALEQLFRTHGYFREELVNLELTESEPERVEQVMEHLRGTDLRLVGLPVVRIDDYLKQESIDSLTGKRLPTLLPPSNSLKYFLERDAWFCIRPSGTEAKIKIYLGVRENRSEKATAELFSLKEKVLAVVEAI